METGCELMRSRSGGVTANCTARLNSALLSTPDCPALSCANIEPQNRRQNTVAHNERELFRFIEPLQCVSVVLKVSQASAAGSGYVRDSSLCTTHSSAWHNYFCSTAIK